MKAFRLYTTKAGILSCAGFCLHILIAYQHIALITITKIIPNFQIEIFLFQIVKEKSYKGILLSFFSQINLNKDA